MPTPLGLFDPSLRGLAWFDDQSVHPEGWFDRDGIPTGSTGAVYTETGTVSAAATVTAADVVGFAETGTAAGASVITGEDALALLETAGVSASASSSALELAAFVETATAAGEAIVVGRDEGGAVPDVPQIVPFVPPAQFASAGQMAGRSRSVPAAMAFRVKVGRFR
jgi:hypothetical protein